MGYDFLLEEKPAEGVVRITLNRPDQRNALSSALRSEIADCMDRLSEDQSVKAVIITGAGSAFCGGFDLKELAGGHTEEIFTQARIYHRKVYTCTKPLIAAVNGPAFAGGMDLAAMCDVRVAAEEAVFAQPQVQMGVPAAFDLIKTLLPESLAREICLTGRKLGVEDALKFGFVSKVVPLAGLPDEALVLAQQMAGAPASGAMKAAFVSLQPDLFSA